MASRYTKQISTVYILNKQLALNVFANIGGKNEASTLIQYDSKQPTTHVARLSEM